MVDRLELGQAWLAQQLKAHASREVIYRRDASEVVVAAVIGRTLLQLDDGYGGVRIERTDRDYLIQATELVLDGVTITPRRGDRIVDATDTPPRVYEVMSYGGEGAWRPSDPFGKLLRIHAKQVGEM